MDENMVKDDQLTEEIQEQPAASEELEQDVQPSDEHDDELDYLNKDDEESDDEPDEEADESEQPEKVYTQKQLDRKLEKRVKKERRNIDKLVSSRVEEEMARLRAEFGQTMGQPQQAQYENQEDDVEDWRNLSPQQYAQRVLEIQEKKRNEQAEKTKQAETQAQYYNNVMSAGADKYDDFEELVGTARYTPAMADAIRKHDNGEDILYFFAHHQDKVADMANKSKEEQEREVNRVAIKLATRNVAQKVSKAPAPASVPKGNTTGKGTGNYVQSLKSNMSVRELARLRNNK